MHHIDRITHTTAFVTPVVEHWLERRQLGFYIGGIYVSSREYFDVKFAGGFLNSCLLQKISRIVLVVGHFL